MELLEVDQVTNVLRLLVVLSPRVPVAVYCWLDPVFRLRFDGVTAIDFKYWIVRLAICEDPE